VAFWSQVFGVWDEDQVVYVDGEDLGRIYEVHRLPASDGTRARDRVREDLRAAHRERIREALRALGEPGIDYETLTGLSRRLYLAWEESRDPEVYREAAERVRGQRGVREEFLAGVARSTRYRDAFRAIFAEEGVPEDLVYLPHVESAYRPDARSSVGAVGMWQFMRGTARKYICVDSAVDERLDPYRAARAAARYLRDAHRELGSWPLAVTSYNHGVEGMRNAVRETGSGDLAEIIDQYQGPLFGFAGRNFYAEFLAVMDLADSVIADPGPLPLDEPFSPDTFVLPAYVKLPTLAGAFEVSPEDLRSLNPSIRHPAALGELFLTRGMQLKLHPGSSDRAAEMFASIPSADRPLTEPQRTYRVQKGDSLSLIAARHRTSVRTLQRLNGIQNPHSLRAGSVLRLPH
jgi:membrane-bound lytic murein transglycosylase D